MSYTKNLRDNLPLMLNKFKIQSIFDAPCGDFNWMKKFLADYPIKYIGGDIVLPLIDINNKKYSCDSINFIHIDITEQPLPYADLLINRDCLFHLSNSDIKKFFINYLNSNIPYILTTSHINDYDFINSDIDTGDFRLIDLFGEPYNLTSNYLFQISDWQKPENMRSMFLWHRDQILEALQMNRIRSNEIDEYR
ncbi:hypothetical protein [Polynucleobacter sp. Adler-ghost]|uniref:hypothetical protein n=1 Tax=Polynucleobacter sp. Adler-ghost TaxID=2770234 RepID=UPI001BFD83AA|nr:hypothetical protein [Polynucleobacter sp. Adler-ghost]